MGSDEPTVSPMGGAEDGATQEQHEAAAKIQVPPYPGLSAGLIYWCLSSVRLAYPGRLSGQEGSEARCEEEG
jgi:hypothetical protein